MPIVDNDDALTAALNAEFLTIIDEIAEELLSLLVDDLGLIDTIVYDAGTPKEYPRQGRTGGLIGMWDKETTVAGNTITSKIGEDSNKMTAHAAGVKTDFIHGSEYWDRGISDIRDLLVEIITEGKSGPFFGDGFWSQPRDFWTPFKNLIEKGKVDKLFRDTMTKRGIRFKKV